MSTVSGKDVLNFFKSADLDTVELVLEVGLDRVKERQAARNKVTENLKKARAAKNKAPNKTASTQDAGQASGQAGQETTEQAEVNPIQAARAARRAAAAGVGGHAGTGHGHIPSVPAPIHTAEATSVASDSEV